MSASASATPAAATPSATASDEPSVPACTAAAARLSLAGQVGQLLMVGVSGELDAAERKAIQAQRVGSVVLLGNSTAGVTRTRVLTDAIGKLTTGSPILVAVDQEGGVVQRLAGPGFDTISSAARQAALPDAALTERAEHWGSQLADAGVQLDLAPVADVVPASKRSTNQPIARLGRGYGSDPVKVSAKVRAVIAGLHAGGVGATVKHFPGLGEVTGNTDFAHTVVDTVTSATHPGLRPFRDAARDGVDAVMISSATYRRIDPDHIAVFSPRVIGLLRDWGFTNVVISDDLGAAAALRSVPVRDRAARFVSAGGDLAINADPSLTAAMADGLVRKAKADPAFARMVGASAARVLALKARLGLLTCN